MKKITAYLKTLSVWTKLSLVIPGAFLLVIGKSFSQPNLDWNFTSEFDNPYFGGAPGTSGADWLYNIIGTSDGGSLGVGFAATYSDGTPTGIPAWYPVAVKLDKNGVMEWDIAYTDGNGIGGTFWDVVEMDGFYYMVGSKSDPADPTHGAGVLVKINPGGTVVYYKYFRKGNLPGFAGWETAHTPPYPIENVGFASIMKYVDPVTGSNRLMLSGSISMAYSSQGIDVAMGALLVNIDKSGNLISGFGYGGNGYQIYEYLNDINTRTIGRHVTKSYDLTTGNVNGFVLTGSTLHAPYLFTTDIHCPNTCNPYCAIKDRDVYLVKTGLTGNITWEKTYDQATFPVTQTSPICATCPGNTFAEAGVQVEQSPCSNDFIVLSHYNLNICYCNTCGFGIMTQMNGVVFGVNGSNGVYNSSVFAATNADYFTSKDFVCQMEVLGDGSVVVGGNKPTTNPWPDAVVELVKLPPHGTGAPIWIGSYPGSDDANCFYGLAQAKDEGFLMADINLLNADDFDVIKTEGELNCSGYRTYTQGGYANNGTPGQYLLLNHYNNCFSAGLTVGCSGNFTMKWNNYTDLRKFLKSHGTGPSVALTANYTNLTVAHCEFEKQVVTLTLNIGFDRCDPCFASAASHLDNLVVTFPPFNGLTVGQVLAEANNALGGCGSIYSLSNLNAVVTAINESFDPSICNGKIDYTTEDCRTQFYDQTISLNGSVITGCYWDFGDGTSSNSRTPLHTYQLPGIYNVCLTDFAHAANPNNGSCEETKCTAVKIDEHCLPGECIILPDFYYETENCTVHFTDYTETGSNTTITHWAWYFGDGSKSSFENPVHTFAKPGTYKVCLVIHGSNGQTECEKSICMNVVITDDCIPEACAVIADFHYVVNGCNLHLEDFSSSTATTITDWNWTVQGLGAFKGDQVDIIVPNSGTYKVCLSVIGIDGSRRSCYDQICKNIIINNCTTPRLADSSNPANNISYSVTPNPSAGNFDLIIASPSVDNLHTEVHNFYGQLIEERTISISKGINKFLYDLSGKAKGIYSLKIFNDNESHLIKIAIQ
jgi:PKD repeat protein